MNLQNRMYKINTDVYIGTRQLVVHNQRGKLYVNNNNKQVNINDVPVLPKLQTEWNDFQSEFLLNYYVNNYCSAMDYFVYRKISNTYISIKNSKAKFNIK
jgi:hypothetical protein